MNALAALAITYLLITICSASILYFSFNGKIDASGKYFFLGELSILPGILAVAIVNINPAYIGAPALVTMNVSTWLSHISILFSIYALSSNAKNTRFIFMLLIGLLYALAIEIYRTTNPPLQITTLIASVIDATFCFWTYFICKSTKDNDLKKNIFFNWIKNIQFMIGLFAIARIISCFTDTPINARDPSFSSNIAYIFYVILNIFRYISYQSLRISWMGDRNNSVNPLNKNLAVVTQEKNHLLQGLIASNRVIGISALASSLAHQLSQPLTTIGLQIETLKRDLNKFNQNEAAVTVLDKINLQLSKLTNLVINLRQLFNTNYQEFHKIDLTSSTDELLDIIQPTLESKGILLTKNLGHNITIQGDAIQFQQVLINILNNAIDSINISNPKSREIKLEIKADSQFAIISVEDTGNGIDENILPSIFELYKTTKKDGLGIGLWLSKTIINKHHGNIMANNSPNGGAIFTIEIPLSYDLI